MQRYQWEHTKNNLTKNHKNIKQILHWIKFNEEMLFKLGLCNNHISMNRWISLEKKCKPIIFSFPNILVESKKTKTQKKWQLENCIVILMVFDWISCFNVIVWMDKILWKTWVWKVHGLLFILYLYDFFYLIFHFQNFLSL